MLPLALQCTHSNIGGRLSAGASIKLLDFLASRTVKQTRFCFHKVPRICYSVKTAESRLRQPPLQPLFPKALFIWKLECIFYAQWDHRFCENFHDFSLFLPMTSLQLPTALQITLLLYLLSWGTILFTWTPEGWELWLIWPLYFSHFEWWFTWAGVEQMSVKNMELS